MTAWPRPPDEALRFLLDGNARFVTGTVEHPNQDAERREAAANTQRPFAVLFGCSDSRVAPTLFTLSGPGDLFKVRNIGNLIPPCDADVPHCSVNSLLRSCWTL